jgi:hypothetical protein
MVKIEPALTALRERRGLATVAHGRGAPPPACRIDLFHHQGAAQARRAAVRSRPNAGGASALGRPCRFAPGRPASPRPLARTRVALATGSSATEAIPSRRASRSHRDATVHCRRVALADDRRGPHPALSPTPSATGLISVMGPTSHGSPAPACWRRGRRHRPASGIAGAQAAVDDYREQAQPDTLPSLRDSR